MSDQEYIEDLETDENGTFVCLDCGGPMADYNRYISCRECGMQVKRECKEYHYRIISSGE